MKGAGLCLAPLRVAKLMAVPQPSQEPDRPPLWTPKRAVGLCFVAVALALYAGSVALPSPAAAGLAAESSIGAVWSQTYDFALARQQRMEGTAGAMGLVGAVLLWVRLPRRRRREKSSP